ncbi:MAG TPA: hypothetical protein VHC22_19110 [Pirellulales bacterium]|nr:hypothetical protein [Pirellulales bacterium]
MRADNKAPPEFDSIYPDVPFVAADSWKAKSDEVGAGLDKLVEYVENHAEEIRAAREKKLKREASARAPTASVGEDTEFVGGPRGAAHRVVSDKSVLYGAECDFGKWNGERAISQIVPIFARDQKRRLPAGAVAREGYAVGGVNVYAQSYVNGIQLIFMRLRDDGQLDKDDSYTSDWITTVDDGKMRTLTGDGAPIIGIHARRGAVIDALALVVKRAAK